MQPTSDTQIKCPACGKPIDLIEHPQFKHILVAYHDCRPGLGMVSVYEKDNPDYKPKTKWPVEAKVSEEK